MRRSNIFIMIIFFIVSLFISLTFNSLESAYQIVKESTFLHTNNAFQFKVSNVKNITCKDFFDDLIKLNNVVLEKDNINFNAYFGKFIYFNNDKVISPPIISGRFLNKLDFNQVDKFAVIGKQLEGLVKYKDKKQYIPIEGEDYLVIGVMGYNERPSIFDETFYISLNGNISIENSSWIIDGEQAKENYQVLKNTLLKINKTIAVESTDLEELKSSFSTILSDRIYLIIIIVLIILTLLLNITSTTNYYIDKKKREIGIRRALGSTKARIYRKIIGEYQLMSIKGFLVSQIVYFIIIKSKISAEVFGYKMMSISIFSMFIVILFIGTIISLIPVIKSNKFHPNEIMRGV